MKIPDEFDSAAASVAGGPATNDPLDKAAAGVVQGQRTALRSSLYGALMANPDMAARAQKLGRQTGLPADVVERNLPEVQRTVQLDEFDQVLKNSPTVAQWMTDQNNAKVAHDDVDNMSAVERATRQLIGGAMESGGMTVGGIGRLLDMAQRRGTEAFSGLFLPKPMAGPMAGVLLQEPTVESLTGSTMGRDWMAASKLSKDFARKDIMIPQGRQTFADQVMGGLGQVGGQIAVQLATGGFGSGLSLFSQGVDTVGDKIDADSASQARKDIAMLGGGVVTAITEKWALDKMLGPLAVPIKNQVLASLARIGIAAGSEGLQEFSENTLHDAIRKSLTNSEASIDIGQSLDEGAIGATVGGIVRSIVEAGLHIRHRGAIAQQSEQNALVLDQLRELATASKVRARDPATFQQFVEQASQDGPVHDIYIDAKTFAQAATDAGMTPEQLPPSVADQLESALVSGGSLRIPVGEFAAQIAPTEYAQWLMDHIKTDPQGMTRAEAKVYMQSYGEELKAQVEKLIEDKGHDLAFNHSIAQVKAVYHDQLNTANRFTPEVNNAYASMIANYYGVQSAKLGITPEAMMERYQLRIQADGVAGAAAQYEQALASQPPKGWKHATEGRATDSLWDGSETSEAIFWTDLKGNLERDAKGFAGYSHSIGKSAIHHIRNNHGNAETEVSRGQLPVTASDVSRIPEIVTGYDDIRTDLVGKHGEPMVAYAKRVDDGVLIYLEAATKKRQNMAGVSMWRYPSTVDVKQVLANAVSPGHYVLDVVTASEKKKGGVTSTTSNTAGIDEEGDTALIPDASDSIVEQTIQKLYQDNPNILNQAAYHGSPHTFQHFSLDHIGSGEGAQAYGWGLYFAEDRGVAAGYFRALADNPGMKKIQLGSMLLTERNGFDYSRRASENTRENIRASLAEDLLINENELHAVGKAGFLELVLQKLDEKIEDYEQQGWDEGIKAAHELRRMLAAPGAVSIDFYPIEGGVYTVEIPDEAADKMLLWDKPLSEQPEVVRQALENSDQFIVGHWVEQSKENPAYNGEDLYTRLIGTLGSDKAASEYLASIGIPGLKYLDGNSRGTGGYHNIVLWDQPAIDQLNTQVTRALYQGSSKDNRGQIAFGQDITQQASVITLFKHADLSTFLHEAGHFFLEVQFDLAARIAGEAAMFGDDTNKPGEQHILADTAELMRWFGVNSIEEWFNLPEEQKRSYHEQFARGFEAYLFEGKAPNIELQGIFQRFRAWMLKVYKDLKNLNVELTDEVRAVMDRMLATTEQIQLAEQGRSMIPLFTSAQQAGMTTEEFADYQALGMDATQSAVEDLQARNLRDMQWMANAKGREVKKLQKESAARRSEMMIEARREIMSQPVYRAWQFLTGKLSKDDKAAVAPDPVPKSKDGPVDPAVDSLFVAIAKLGGLDRDQVRSQWGLFKDERSPQPLFGKPLLRKTDGLSLDAMGEALAEEGYLPKDEHGKFDPADLEAKFDAEYRGDTQYSVAFEYAAAVNGEKLAGQDADLENLGAGRIDLRAIKDLGIPDEIVEHIVNLKMTAKDGIDPDLVAESFGFTSGDELVRSLAATEAPKVAIEALTDQKMLERYGELSSPEAIARAADAAIHNDVRARFVAAELNALAKATGKPKVLASAAREYAKAMIDRLLVRNIKPTQYATAEARAAKASEKASKSGDLEQVAVEKRNQLISSYATKAAYDAQAEMEKALRYLAKFEREGTRKSIYTDYLDQIDSILERFDLRTGQSLKSIDKRKALAEWIGAQEELGIEVELPEKIRAEAFRQSYKDLSVEEMRGLVDSVKQIEHLGRLKEKLLTAADNRRFADIVASMVASIEEHAGDKRANNRTRDTLGNRALRLFNGFVASHRKTASLARELDGFQDAGPMWTYLIQSMNTAGDREATMRAEATTRLAEMLKPVLAEGRMGKKQFIAEIGDSLTRGEQIVVALNMGNAGNMQRLADGRMWTGEQIGAVTRNLSSADWQFVQKVWDFFESYRPQIAAKERRVMGKEPNWVEPQQLTVYPKGGVATTLRGGYFPIVYDARESGRAERQADAEAAKQMMKGAFVAATTRRSFTKTRAEEVSGRPLLLTWDALFRGANDVIHDLAWHEWVIDANRIVKNDQVDKAIRNTYGADVIHQFKAAIRDVAAGDAPNLDALSKVMTPLRSGAAVAGLGFNLMNAMLQPLGLTQSMVRVGAKWVGMGIAEWAKSPVGLVTQVHEKSEFMRNRSRTQQRELNEIQSVVQGKSEVREKIDSLMFMPMQSLQLIADIPTWWGAYQKALAEAQVGVAEEVAEELAIKLADQAVIDAQGGGQVKDLALIQRGGPMQKLFTVFYGFFSTAYNLGVERAKETNYRSPLEVMHLAGDFLLLYSVPAVLASLLKDALTPGGGDDPEKLARKLIGEQISYLMGLMVGVREMTGAVQYATGTKQFDTSYGGPAGLRFFQELEKLAKQVNQGELNRALARSVVNVGGVLLALPSAQANRTIDGVAALQEGKTDNPAALLFGYDKGK
jgi:hypothetical protein